MSIFQLPRRRTGTINGRPARTSLTNGNGTNDSGASQSGNGNTATAATTISSSDYARRCRELLNLARDLRDLGANAVLDFPSITVIGGQSAGKSSLVEAVSGINVPRDSGTCTRCPMECSMSSSADSWSCTISLRIDYNVDGTRLDPSALHNFGPTLTNKKDVELWLRRAQAAILNPHLPREEFHSKTEQELRNPPQDEQRLQFSKNAVLVDVCDPTITDLSFIDLPGLIQNERPEVIDVIRELAVSRIETNNTLILVTIPMSDDLKNQQAARLAREADPAGERTIAVLTKPDILGAGSTGLRQTWTEVLEGTLDPLTHGYYCVRLPDDAERAQRLSRTESERRAMEYFNSTHPWRDISDRSRFGVDNLAKVLSKLLVERIEANLPSLKEKLSILLAQYNKELSQLPSAPSSQPAAEVLLRVTAFCREFAAAVGGSERKTLAQDCRRLYSRFRVDIHSTCPDFRPFVTCEVYPHSPVSAASKDTDAEVSPTGSAGVNVPLDLEDVRKVISDSTSWELPTYVPYDATRALVAQFTAKWSAPSITCFNAVVDVSAQFIDDLLVKHFRQFTQLENHIRSLTREELSECKRQAHDSLQKILALETDLLFTQNTPLFVSEHKTWLARYKSIRNWSNGIEQDEYAEELTLMSKVRAYWQIAYQRIIDYVPLMIEHEFNHRLAGRLEGILFEDLLKGSDVTARMQELLTEDPLISARRRTLGDRIERLLEIKKKLDGLS